MKTGKKIYSRNSFELVFSLFAILLISGCEKVVEIDLNDASPNIVIEGLVTDKRGPYTVSISKTGSYFNQPSLETVSGATVVITDDFNNIDTLDESTPGLYVTSRTRGIYERTYTLKVIAEEKVYTGSTRLADRVPIDSLRLRKGILQGFNFDDDDDTQIDLHCFFRDPRDKNYYRIRVFKNDSINTESYRLYDDQYANGLITDIIVSHATLGNTYRIELWSLDRQTYLYYNTLGDLMYSNPIFGSTPSNPVTNLSNGALGYFGSYSVTARQITITEELINSIK
jgi:hypothetical protein